MAYVAKRMLIMLPVLFIVSVMVFSLIHLIPGDPAQVILGQDATPASLHALRVRLGLNLPIVIQYLDWMSGILRGNFGQSLTDGVPVSQLILESLPVTLELAVGTFLVSLLVAFPLGVLAAVYRGRVADATALFTATLGLSVPPFWLGMLLLFAFTVRLHWFPSSGYVPFWINPWQNMQAMVLPIIATGVREAAVLLRMLRTSMLEVLHLDYIRTARAKGLSGWVIIVRHALKNALIPVITTGGLQLAGLLGGLVITETVFSLPGFGNLLVQSIFSRDYTTIQGAALVAALMVIFVNLAVDLFYGWVDPRIHVTEGED